MPQHPGMSKRQKELARQEKRKNKDEKRDQRKREKPDRPDGADAGSGAEDPDIAGIIPGPQPPLEGY